MSPYLCFGLSIKVLGLGLVVTGLGLVLTGLVNIPAYYAHLFLTVLPVSYTPFHFISFDDRINVVHRGESRCWTTNKNSKHSTNDIVESIYSGTAC